MSLERTTVMSISQCFLQRRRPFAISIVLSLADQPGLEHLPVTLAWLPQSHPSPKTSCIKVHDDETGNQDIHDQVGSCHKNMLLRSRSAREKRHNKLADHPLNGPNAGFQDQRPDLLLNWKETWDGPAHLIEHPNG